MNTCAKCLTEKPRSAFGADKRNSTGLQSICNQCYKDKRNGIEATCDKAKCSKCKEIKKISGFYKDAYTKKGHKSECIDCSKKAMKKSRDALKKACVKCEKPKTAISFSGDSNTCKVCEKKAIERIAIRPAKKPSGAIEKIYLELSAKANTKTKNEIHNRNVREIQKKGYIKSAEVQQVTKIIKPDLYSANIRLNVDNRIINYQIGEFKTQFELGQNIESIYQNTTNVAQQYLEVVS